MPGTKPSIWRSVAAGYRDGSRAICAMPALAGVAFLISLAHDWAYRSLRSSAPTRDLGHDTLLAAMVLLAIASFLRTPILIAVHRFVLREEVTAGYRLEPSDPRFRRFFGCWLSLSLMPLLPAWLGRLARSGSPDVVLQMLGLVLIVLMLVGCVLVLRLTILLPAIAVDAPGATWRNAYRDTRGYVLRLLGISCWQCCRCCRSWCSFFALRPCPWRVSRGSTSWASSSGAASTCSPRCSWLRSRHGSINGSATV